MLREVGPQLGLLHLCQPLLQALLGPDLSLQRRLQLQPGRGLHLLQPPCLPLVVLAGRGSLAVSEAIRAHHCPCHLTRLKAQLYQTCCELRQVTDL